MSQIFDALHESATSPTDNGSHRYTNAKELLELVEHSVHAPTATTAAPAHAPARDFLRHSPSVQAVPGPSSKFVCFTEPDSLAAENFRFLATRLRHMQQKRTLRRLVITSSTAGEGKSLISANLACALAGGKQRILLLEGDLRRCSLAQQLGLRHLPGLNEVLQQTAALTDCIHYLDTAGFCVLLGGDVQRNPLELVKPEELSQLIDEVSSGFDWVIIDSPPVLPFADTSIWMRLAEGILLVTRPGITSKRQLQRTIETLEQPKLIGAVVNASQDAIGNNYYYHYPSRPRTDQSSVKPSITASRDKSQLRQT